MAPKLIEGRCQYNNKIVKDYDITSADQNIDTTVDDSLTLEVIDTTTVLSFCTVLTAPSNGDIVRPTGDFFSFTMQSKSSDWLDQPMTDDVYTVTLTSIIAEE